MDETEGEIIDDLGFFKGEEGLVIAARWEESVVVGWDGMRRRGMMGTIGIMGVMWAFCSVRIAGFVPIVFHRSFFISDCKGEL